MAGRDPVVQPDVAARAAVSRSLHSGPGAVAGQRHTVPPQELPHPHPRLTHALSMATHLQVPHPLRDQA